MWLTKVHTSQEAPTSTSGSSSLRKDKLTKLTYVAHISIKLRNIVKKYKKVFLNPNILFMQNNLLIHLVYIHLCVLIVNYDGYTRNICKLRLIWTDYI